MSTVKGSKQERMVVVPYRPWRRSILRGALLALVLLGAVGGYFTGFSQGVGENGDARGERDQLLVDLRQQHRQIEELRRQLVAAEQAGEVDRQALEQVQGTIAGLRGSIALLEEDVLFYKRIMSPENQDTGLVIGQLDLYASADPRRFRYHVELKQMGDNASMISGYANVDILGRRDGVEQSLSLHTLSELEAERDIKLGFRYFQNIDGDLRLPPGFVPSSVQILAVAEDGGGKTVRKSFGWLVQE